MVQPKRYWQYITLHYVTSIMWQLTSLNVATNNSGCNCQSTESLPRLKPLLLRQNWKQIASTWIILPRNTISILSIWGAKTSNFIVCIQWCRPGVNRTNSIQTRKLNTISIQFQFQFNQFNFIFFQQYINLPGSFTTKNIRTSKKKYANNNYSIGYILLT